MRFFSPLLLLGAEIWPAATSNGVTTTPPHFDEWCEERCSSWEACNLAYDQNYVDLRLRVKFPIDEGPGRHLILDKYFGNTISRQSFETQFVLDVASALESSPCRLYVTSVFPEGTGNYWDTDSVFITFRLFPADATFVAALTKLIQEPDSVLYSGRVTHATDTLYGLAALQWDYSVKLMYSISIVGGDDVVDSDRGRYLNEGSLQSCTDPSQTDSTYCIFETYLVDDMERALGLKSGQFIVLFVKQADRHSVIVSFRLAPEMSLEGSGQDTAWVQSKVTELIAQMYDSQSHLYSGNLTFKIDPTWGVSKLSKKPRKFSKLFLSRPIPPKTIDAYERCKATHRCPRAWGEYNQSSAHTHHTFQEYLNGKHVEVPLFLDFEDWRRGIRGWEQSCRGGETGVCLPASVSEKEPKIPAGAHWSPFEFDALGPSVPTVGKLWNNGLVLNKIVLDLDIKDQLDLIEKYESLVAWMDQEFQHGVTGDAMLRSREQIRENITNYTETISAEKYVLAALVQSQCSNVQCNLLFNTSDASLSGAVNATGVITTTPDGTEVALWAFDSINIDEHVNITLTGQRAMALVSRSSVRINTTLNALPGTLGGFPGGLSVARRPNERFVRVCKEQVDSRQFLDTCKGKSTCCPGDQPISELKKDIKSNNVNGPGSPSSRVYLMTIQTSAPIVNEIQSITTRADRGQTLSGGMRLHFNGYSTPLLSHDITASDLKRKMEDSLNPAKRNQLTSFDRTESAAGLGVVDVTRESFGSSGGYRWNITFVSAVGNIGVDSSRLNVTNYLVSKGARVDVETVRHGNSIGGKFALHFLGNQTRFMKHDVMASDLGEILLQDIAPLSTAHVLRSDPTGNCNDGHCANGAGRSGGYTWTLTLTTPLGNISPFSPTSMEFDDEGVVTNMTALNQLTGCVDTQCPTIQIDMGHSRSHSREMRSIDGKKPFSLAFGGAGAGYGGEGGDGFGDIPSGKSYNDERISNLHGGSGGGVGVKQPFQLGVFKDPRGRGGSGGGAIEIVAINDIIIGSNASISCDGESGANGYMSAGGGGSGGTVLLAAGGVVQIDGKISAIGGAGGHKKADIPKNAGSFGGHGGGGAGGRMAFFSQSVVLGSTSMISLDGGNCSLTAKASQNCTGGDGTLFVASDLDTELTVDRNIGAEGTRGSLYLRPRMKRPPFNPRKLLSSTESGPEYDLGASVRPSRVSFYFRVENSSKSGWDATFELRESRWSYLSSKDSVYYTAMIGIVIGKQIRHGVNYIGVPFDDEHIKQLKTIKPFAQTTAWTKVDIRFNWKDRTHDVYVDDIRLVKMSSFRGESIRAISLHNYYDGGRVWFDEIYIGEDSTMGFHCPVVLPNGTFRMDRPLERGWNRIEVGEYTSSLRLMRRHESHVSTRTMYQREDNKFVVPFDGQGENDFTSDVKFLSGDGDRIHEKGKFLAGSLLRLPRSQSLNNGSGVDFGMHPDTFIWYGEHDHLVDPRQVTGAVMACSTQDFVTWTNEGVMLHYANLTDMVNGGTSHLHVEKPKVLYNNLTQKYVMWMIIDNGIRELGLAGVAVSDYPNGPFAFVRSLYPDGNQTRDQTLFQDDDGVAYLFRTYYDTVENVLPTAVMQPTWESVKNSDGTTNFPLSFHRAEYHPGYDDYHDIYLQRWRTEDKPWKIICINRLTRQEREVSYGKENLNFDGEVCQDPFEYKKVLGQGNPTYENSKDGIPSRFLDPNDPANNVWIPNSVLGVKGQPWASNYVEGTCGKRKTNNDMQPFDPDLPHRELPDRGDCSNISDNPIHPTLPDKRIGPETIVERRRAKYVAVSRLTDDYLDTSGTVKTFEGELDGLDLLSIVRQYSGGEGDSFGWTDESAKEEIGTTFQPRFHDNQFAQALNWDLEHHQYTELFNDRSFYSPACVYDGQCPKRQ